MILAVDQNGQEIHLKGENPRKELMEYLGAKRASRLFRDKKDGSTVHVGYVLPGDRWFTLYNVTPWEKPVGTLPVERHRRVPKDAKGKTQNVI